MEKRCYHQNTVLWYMPYRSPPDQERVAEYFVYNPRLCGSCCTKFIKFCKSCRHEIANIVTEVGCNVGKFKIGDKVEVGALLVVAIPARTATKTKRTTASNSYSPTIQSTMMALSPMEAILTRWSSTGTSWSSSPRTWRWTSRCSVQGSVHSNMKNLELNDPVEQLGLSNSMGSTASLSNLARQLGAIRTMDGIINTVSVKHDLMLLIALLKMKGKLVMVRIPEHPFEIHVLPLTITGSLIGGMKNTQEMIVFAGEHNIIAEIELISADYVNEVMKRLAKADVRYRFVIDINNTLNSVKQLS